MKKSLALILVSLLAFNFQVRAIEYELPDIHGETQSINQYLGKWVVVNYWATWCSTCRKEFPELIALHKNSKNQNIAVVGINFETIDNQRLKKFVARQGITYPVLRSMPVPVTAIGKVPALPATYIIDPEGKVVAGNIGLITQQDIENYITKKKSENTISNKPKKVSYQLR
jgi:peroxiredoxin